MPALPVAAFCAPLDPPPEEAGGIRIHYLNKTVYINFEIV
jgi:hypothetical protein